MNDISLILPEAKESLDSNDTNTLLCNAILAPGKSDDKGPLWDKVKSGICTLALSQLQSLKDGKNLRRWFNINREYRQWITD